MAEYIHRVVIITALNEPVIVQDMFYLQERLAKGEYRFDHLLQGPVVTSNGFVQYIFCSAAGKRGGPISQAHLEVVNELLKKYGTEAVMVSMAEDDQNSPTVVLGGRDW